MDIYTVKDTDIVYETSVDFGTRQVPQDIHVVQYDSSQPIIAVELYKNGRVFKLPAGYEANVRFGKKDRTFVYKPVLGCSSDRTTLYFKVDEQMTLIEGRVGPIIELAYSGSVVGSSPIPICIDRNPIQVDDVESQAEYPAIMERLTSLEIVAKILVTKTSSTTEASE